MFTDPTLRQINVVVQNTIQLVYINRELTFYEKKTKLQSLITHLKSIWFLSARTITQKRACLLQIKINLCSVFVPPCNKDIHRESYWFVLQSFNSLLGIWILCLCCITLTSVSPVQLISYRKTLYMIMGWEQKMNKNTAKSIAELCLLNRIDNKKYDWKEI